MRRKLFVIMLTAVMLVSASITVFAATPELFYDSAFDDETGMVTVSIYIKNAVGTQSADLNLAYDPAVYEYQSSESIGESQAMIAEGKAISEDGLCTCSLVFAESCQESDLDADGNLALAKYVFKPKSENYDINGFTFWASSFDSDDGGDIAGSINVVGDAKRKDSHNVAVTVPNVQNNNTENDSSKKSSKWYVYLIVGVLAVAAIVGIALIAIKAGRGGNESDEEDSDSSEDEASDQDDED